MDDELDILDALQHLFENIGDDIVVLRARNADEARQILRDNRVDALLVDQRLAGTLGLDFIAEVQILRPDVPAILMTAYPSSDVYDEAAKRRQVVAVVHKPFHNESLIHLVRHQLRQRRGDAGRVPPAPRG